jgi:hypothetical protein
MSGTGALGQAGAACFGIAVGYLAYRTLVRTAVNASIFVLAAVVAVIGGAAVTGLFVPGTGVFAWYSIGLLAGMAVFFAIFGRLNGLQRLAAVLSVRTEAPGDSRSSEQGPNPAAGQPEGGEVS